jgi:polysaccharide export outer membrane protein
MIHNKTIKSLGVFATIILMFVLNACGSKKNLSYFTEIQKDSITLELKQPIDAVIRKGDLLNIRVSSSDELTVARINGISGPALSGPSAAGAGASSATGAGYLVNDTGFITLAMIGKVKAEGLKKEALADTIKNRLIRQKFVLDAIVSIRISNFKITVLGEVNRPGVINVPDEKITLTDAISISGDMTVYAKRENILIIRIKDGKRIYKRIDFSKNEVFDSDYYYLQNQDIVYIEPNKKKAKALDNTTQVYSLILSTISIFALVYTQLVR